MTAISTFASGSGSISENDRTAVIRSGGELDSALVRLGLIGIWRTRIRFRRHLARLSKDGPALIEDIGLTVAQVDMELAKPFWRA